NHTLGLDIAYTHEELPLGTIGPIHLIEHLDETFLVMNGDILTDLNFTHLIQAHKKSGSIATVATFQREVKIDFGVLEKNQKNKIITFREKPTYYFDVSMGIYVFSKKILEYIPIDTPFGFDQLIQTLIEKGEHADSYLFSGFWLDIGRPDDYARSIEEFERFKDRFLP
ncbi:MAG: sugar phosphate nucleotidyltransferase, partial [Methanomicrobiales archaeon]